MQSAVVGSATPQRALVVLSGVHGVEGFATSAMQVELLDHLVTTGLPGDVGVLLVHAVNPWGMAWWRRQNEHNVDLNRNWRRDHHDPLHNDAYDEVHHLACPDTDELPDAGELLALTAALVEDRGLVWLRDALTVGQYRHADGLHFGGHRTETSNLVLERIVSPFLAGAERLLTLDLHTGHGPHGAVTLLSDQPIGSPQDRFLREHFGQERVEATVDNPDATTGVKHGQIANGLAELAPGARCFASSVEVGTVSDVAQLVATYHEHWVHRRGDRSRPEHSEAVWAYRDCFSPDDAAWEQAALRGGAEVLHAGVRAVCAWTG